MNVIGFLNENSSAVTAFSGMLTVIVTCFYVIQIDKQRHEMIKSKFWLNDIFANVNQSFNLKFDNNGMGHAFEVEFECLFSKNAILKKLSLNYFKYLFGFQFIKLKTKYEFKRIFSSDTSEYVQVDLSPEMVEQKCGCVKIKVVYVDELGKKQKTKKYYNLKDFSF